jgi:Transposase, Mutator family
MLPEMAGSRVEVEDRPVFSMAPSAPDASPGGPHSPLKQVREVRNVSLLMAIGVGLDGFREILGVAEGAKEDKASWTNFLRLLKERGLKGVKLLTSDRCLGLVESLADFFPEAAWQRCVVHFYRNVFALVPATKVREVAAMLKAIHAQEAKAEALAKVEQVASKLELMKLGKAAELVRTGAHETLSYYAFPEQHWRRIRTNNPMQRIMREIRRRTRVVGCFPDGSSALMLVSARLRHIAGTKWGTRVYLDMKHFRPTEATTEALVAGYLFTARGPPGGPASNHSTHDHWTPDLIDRLRASKQKCARLWTQPLLAKVRNKPSLDAVKPYLPESSGNEAGGRRVGSVHSSFRARWLRGEVR